MENEISCTCKCPKHHVNGHNIGEIVSEVVSRNIKSGKTLIKLEIEMVT